MKAGQAVQYSEIVTLPTVRPRRAVEWLGRLSAYSAEAAGLTSVLLKPVSVVALTLALWQLGDEMGWTGSFPIRSGIFAHWIVWLGIGIGIQLPGPLLLGPGRASEPADPDHARPPRSAV